MHALLCGQASRQAEEHVGDHLRAGVGEMVFERREVAIDFRLCRKAAFDPPLANVADEGARALPALVTRREGRRAVSYWTVTCP